MNLNKIQVPIDNAVLEHKQWLDPNELETEFNISKSTQAKKRMNRTIPFHKVGKYIRYKREDINQMFEDAKVI